MGVHVRKGALTLRAHSRNVSLADSGSRQSALCSGLKIDKDGFLQGRASAPGRCHKDARVLYYIYLFFQPTRNEVETQPVACCVLLYLSYRMSSQGVSKPYPYILLIARVLQVFTPMTAFIWVSAPCRGPAFRRFGETYWLHL